MTMTYIRDNPDIVKRMKEEGHQVGNHTVHHPCMPEKSVEEQKSELKECSDFMRNETGYEMDMYFRRRAVSTVNRFCSWLRIWGIRPYSGVWLTLIMM